jgi:hypothetical protein
MQFLYVPVTKEEKHRKICILGDVISEACSTNGRDER